MPRGSIRTWLLFALLALFAFPAVSQEIEQAEGPANIGIGVVLELLQEKLEAIWATFGPEMEPVGSPTSSDPANAAPHNTATEVADDPNFGPEMEPVG